MEFQTNKLLEFNIETGEFRINIFYYDPMHSSQKSKKRNYFRDIITNDSDIYNRFKLNILT
jgi:hypothetical protein